MPLYNFGTMGAQNSGSVSITGGSIDGTVIGSTTMAAGSFSNLSANGLKVVEGANAKQGVVTLVAGVATVSNTSVTANSRIFLTSQSEGGTPGFVRVSARVAGTSFTVTSSSALDTSVIAYEILEPA